MRPPLVPLLAALLLTGCAVPGPADDAGDAVVTFDGVRFETEAGTFTAILFPDQTPETATFFGGLVERGYYDGRAFGRVIPGFVIQEVDRTGGTTDQPEKVRGEFGTDVMFSAGAIGIARDADPDSGSSEFFVMDFAAGHLWGNYTAFAQVVEGMEVVHTIARVPSVRTGPAGAVGAPPGSPVAFGVHDRVPVDPVAMTKVTLVEVTLPAAVAARYPLRVGAMTVEETYRATLEWPRDLRANASSTLAWYVAPRDPGPQGQARDPPPVELAGAQVVVEGASNATLAVTEDPAIRGILRFDWTPTTPGPHVVRLVRDGETLAATDVTVPG